MVFKVFHVKSSGTDWKRVKREAVADASIHFDAATEPYDPNDAAAVDAYWQSATIKRPTLKMRVDAQVLDAFKATGPG